MRPDLTAASGVPALDAAAWIAAGIIDAVRVTRELHARGYKGQLDPPVNGMVLALRSANEHLEVELMTVAASLVELWSDNLEPEVHVAAVSSLEQAIHYARAYDATRAAQHASMN